MKAALLAGVAYFTVLFGTGAAFDLARIHYVGPHLSPLMAFLFALPVILAVAYLVCSWITDYLRVGTNTGHCIAMGGTTFTLLVAADVALSLVLAGEPSRAAAAATTSEPGLGFAVQALASAFPLMVPVVRALTGKSKARDMTK
jgi:hypothetical protein